MEIIGIFILIISVILIIVSFIFAELRKIRILLERPRIYREKLDRLIEHMDESIKAVKDEYFLAVQKGFSKEELKKLNSWNRISGLQKLKQETYRDFYSDTFTPENLK